MDPSEEPLILDATAIAQVGDADDLNYNKHNGIWGAVREIQSF